jgi:hypothetical protein
VVVEHSSRNQPQMAVSFPVTIQTSWYVDDTPFDLPALLIIMQEPQGFLQTELIIDVVTQFLPMTDKSILQPRIGPETPPIGLYGLILTAVSVYDALEYFDVYSSYQQIDRALSAYLPKGVFSTPDDFKHDFYWKQLQQFVRKMKTVKTSRWEVIFDATLGASASEADPGHVGNISVVSNYRDELYIPGSPLKH